ncbi:MAG: hypothetical protein IJH59_00040 [Firmicutes bacterium]|nr:hypothetical protein [Bacillota bacterium]
MAKNSTFRLCLILPLLLLTAAMMARPEKTVAAARSALTLWARAVAPSLLPFFILAQLLVALGAAQLAGRRLAPLMRPLFDLPGEAALGLVMGFCSGFPTGAAVAAELRRDGAITAEEGGRLLAFTNNAGPLFVTATVASSLLQTPEAAALLCAAHYGGNLLLGLVFGLCSRARRGRWEKAVPPPEPAAGSPAPPLAALMKAAAQRAAANLLLIGCYMAFFAVAAALLVPAEGQPLLKAGVSGLLEMSLGINALAESGLETAALLPLIGAELAFGGLSVQMQVLAMTADTDISPRLYLLSRPLHAALSALFIRVVLPFITLPRQASEGGAGMIAPAACSLLRRSLYQAGLIAACWWLIALLAPKEKRRG